MECIILATGSGVSVIEMPRPIDLLSCAPHDEVMNDAAENQSYLEQHWAAGQDHLGAGRYGAARRELETAERIAWRQRNAQALGRIYLPLLETRRQIRYQAVEGTVVICGAGMGHAEWKQGLAQMLKNGAGTILVQCPSKTGVLAARRFAGTVQYAAWRTGLSLETLLLLRHGGGRKDVRVATAEDATFAGGLTVRWTGDTGAAIGATTEAGLIVPLPPAGVYRGGQSLHAMARESLLVAWETLALRWQHRHPASHHLEPWDEIAWLRLALRIDPACEPISMRLMSLAETIERSA